MRHPHHYAHVCREPLVYMIRKCTSVAPKDREKALLKIFESLNGQKLKV